MEEGDEMSMYGRTVLREASATCQATRLKGKMPYGVMVDSQIGAAGTE